MVGEVPYVAARGELSLAGSCVLLAGCCVGLTVDSGTQTSFISPSF